MRVAVGGWKNWRELEGQMMPRWMGIAGYDPQRDRVLLLPLPLNIIYGTWTRFMAWARSGAAYRAEQIAYSKGRTAGHAEGYDRGYEHGKKDGVKSVATLEELEQRVEALANKAVDTYLEEPPQ